MLLAGVVPAGCPQALAGRGMAALWLAALRVVRVKAPAPRRDARATSRHRQSRPLSIRCCSLASWSPGAFAAADTWLWIPVCGDAADETSSSVDPPQLNALVPSEPPELQIDAIESCVAGN